MRRLSPVFRGSITYLASNLINAAIPFALLPVLTRFLSPAEYGEVAMFQTFVGALGGFVGIGVAAAVTRKHFEFANPASEDPGQFIGACFQIVLVSGLLALVVCMFARQWLARVLGLDPAWIPWGVAVTAAGVIVQVRLAQWQVREQAFTYGAFQVAQSLVNMLFSLALVVGFRLGADGRIAAQATAMIAAAVAALFWLRLDRLLKPLAWRPEFLKEILAYGVPLMPHVLAAFVLFSIDRVVINAQLGLADAGVYMVAAQLSAGVSLVFDAIARAYTPWLFGHLQRNNVDQNRMVVRSTYGWFFLILLGAALVFAAGPSVITFVAGERYAKAGTVIGWLVLGQAFMGMYLLLSGYLLFAKRTGLLSTVTVVSSGLYICLLVVLVREFALKGAAIGFAAAMALRLVLTWWAAHRSHPMPWLMRSPKLA